MKKSELRQIIKEEIDKVINENFNSLEKWKIASNKLENLRKLKKINTKDYYQAYADYYEGMIELKGDDNGYYYGKMKKFQKLADESIS